MDEFSYLSVLISIILGLGITQLLSGFARWIEQRETFRAYGPAMAWTAMLLLVHVQGWWSMFGMRHHRDWTFLQFGIVLLQPITLYLMAALVLPGANSPELDLRRNYFAQRRWLFGLMLALLIISVAKDVVLNGSLPAPANLAFHAFLFVTASIAIATENETFHRFFAYTSAVFFALYIGLLFARLE
ncbi:MAG TPA: hypothetical protein VH394_08885 [Thermoanaerobaculia bacterium]|nr:hypothetical protein [Thermoanaerobaculia bacterium]